MNIYCIEFKCKGDTTRLTAIIAAVSETAAYDHFISKYANDASLDVDKRTIRWGGSSIPMAMPSKDGAASFIHHGEIKD